MTSLLEFDHVGIVVDDVDGGIRSLAGVLGITHCTRRFNDEILGVSVRFARDDSGIVYEMIAPLGDRSPVAKTLRDRSNLLNQIAYRCGSLEPAAAHMRAQCAAPVGRPQPALAFDGARVQFFMSPLGFLMELIEIGRVVHAFNEPVPAP